ncbi:MAG: beta-ketoacyl-[acyl-carrier-protein] synthase family protein [Phycisphaerales bacterium]|nr:beta-ketoacyl-[acyl-carrier-protein] synthase family protein [Phycisphaerales bacterium]
MNAASTRSATTRRVVVTGMGWITPLGTTIDGVWSKLVTGASAVGPITRFPASSFATNFAAEVRDFRLSDHLADTTPHVHAHLNAQYALAAASHAWRLARLTEASSLNPRRVGVYLGAGEGILDFENYVAANLAGWNAETRTMDDVAWHRVADARLEAHCEMEQEPNMPLSHIARAFNVRGPAYNSLTACAASTQAIGEATEIVRRGRADVMIAGGAHTMIHPLGVTGFIRLTALSGRTDDHATASRPFDQTRDGFVMGEGAGIVILEELEHARARGVTPLAEIIGYGSSADAYRITDIQPEGLGAVASMNEALVEAGIDPRAADEQGRPQVHYVSAHGTGTKENDSVETRAIKHVFGDLSPRIPMSSIKSMMGHLIQAAGAVELISCVQAIATGWLPPTINVGEQDANCDLDVVPNKARDLNPKGGVEVCLSNSFGFGGQNDSIVVRRFDPASV